MTTPIWLATGATAIVAAIAAAPANPATTARQNCGTVDAGGTTWHIAAFGGVACSTARPLVKKLATKPHPTPRTSLGRYLGMTCSELTLAGARTIGCSTANSRRGVVGVTRTSK